MEKENVKIKNYTTIKGIIILKLSFHVNQNALTSLSLIILYRLKLRSIR